MSTDNSIIKLTGLYFVGSFISKLLNFGLFFVYTFFLSKEEIGTYDLIITTTSLIIPLITVQIYDSLFRWLIAEKDHKVQSTIISNSIFILFTSLIFFTIIYFPLTVFLDFKFKIEIYLFTILQVIFLAFQQISRSLGQNMVYTFGGILHSFLFLILSCIGLIVFNLKLQGLLIASSISFLIVTIFFYRKIKLKTFFFFELINKEKIKDLIRYSLPLVPNMISWWIIASSNRYFILLFLGPEKNGDFAVALKLPSILIMLTGIFSLAWQEKSIQRFEESGRDEYYTEIYSKYTRLLFGSVLILISTVKFTLDLIVDNNYFNVWSIIPVLYVSVIYQALSSFVGIGYLGSKKTKGAFSTTIYGALSTLLISFVLIPKIGLLGSSIGILGGYLIMLIVRIFQTKKYFRINYNFRELTFYHLMVGICILFLFFDNILIQILNILFSIGIALYLNRNEVRKNYNKFVSSKIVAKSKV